MNTSTKIICILVLSLGIGNVNAQTTYNYTGSLQTWTVPCGVTSVTIDSYGAQGGENGGLGAEVKGTFAVSPGTTIDILVGQQGLTSGSGNGGGGGGSFVWNAGNDSLLIAAGGGGGYSTNGGSPPGAGSGTSVTTNGGGSGSGAGGTGGHGGVYGANTGHGADGLGGGGAGWLSNGGTNPGVYSEGEGQGGFYPLSIVTPGGGGANGNVNGAHGGYGGGGGSSGASGASGGGGGYNGGGGGNAWSGSQWGSGGGGGSYNRGSSQTNVTGTNAGNGKIIITQNSVPPVTTDTGFVVSNVTCNGANNGIAASKVGGGTPYSFTYSWAPGGQTTDTVRGLSPGTYTISVTGYCGSATSTVTISQPNVLTSRCSVITNVSCYQSNNAAASAITSGGISPYTYLWTGGGGTNSVATGLSAGIYRVTVIDNNGCIAFASVSITQPDVLTAGTNVTSNASCGISNGSATSTVGGGTLPYTYSWTDGETTASVSGLSGGTYTLNVTDNNGCRASSSIITISETPAVFASAATNANIICYGDNVGLVSCRVNGGTLPYSYLWSPGGNTDYSVANLSGGTYTITVTDANGCISSASTTITQPSPITIVKDSTADLKACTGSAWVVVNGGIPPYTYLWSPGGNTSYYLYDQCGGTYCCTVTDGQGCTKSVCIRVTSPTGIDNVADNSGSVTVYPNPNNGEFTIESTVVSSQWSVEVYNILGEKVYSQLSTQNSQLTINISNQPNGVYLYRVLTENGNLLGEGKIIIQK